MKIGEWDELGRARSLLQRQVGELHADEFATHVTVNPDNGRLRILVAADIGLLEYSYAPAGADPEGPWTLRGQLYRWVSVHGLRLQTDAQIDESTDQVQEIWRLVAEDPRIDLSVTNEAGPKAIDGLLVFARACLMHAA
jgi:hypothetical protein